MITTSLTEEDLNEFLAADTREAMIDFRKGHHDWEPCGLEGRREQTVSWLFNLRFSEDFLISARAAMVAALNLRALPDDCTIADLENEDAALRKEDDGCWHVALTLDGLNDGYIRWMSETKSTRDTTILRFLDEHVVIEDNRNAVIFREWSYDDMPKPKAIADSLAGWIAAAHMSKCRVLIGSDFEEHIYADSLVSELWHAAIVRARAGYITRCDYCGAPIICGKPSRGHKRRFCYNNDLCKNRFKRTPEKAYVNRNSPTHPGHARP